MDRLTEIHENGTAMIKGCGANCKYGYAYCRKEIWENCKTIDDVIDKLADYEDAEEQGLLLRLPLQEGTQVYCIGSCGEICDDYFTDCEVCGEHKVVFTTAFDRNMIEQFGKTVFEKEEEANQALCSVNTHNEYLEKLKEMVKE